LLGRCTSSKTFGRIGIDRR